MSFFDLNIGIQQTCNRCEGYYYNYYYKSTSHSFKCLSCFIDNDYIELLSTELVPP